MIDTVRTRLTLWYVGVLAAALVVVAVLIYVLLERALYLRIDDTLIAGVRVATTSLENDLREGQSHEDSARSTAAELSAQTQMFAIYDAGGRLLAEGGRDSELEIVLPPLETIPDGEVLLQTILESDGDDRHRLAFQRVSLAPYAYVVVAGVDLEPLDEELEFLRGILFYIVPLALAIAGVGGWFLARQALSPVVAMADRARRIGAETLSARLPVANPRDELGRLAETFNELLGRLEMSLTQQRQFMADASHELRTPVATARTAASVTLQQEHREEADYRETLGIIEQQTVRLSRVVDDMFTLARADAGNFPVRSTPMYLEEVVDEVVRAARVIASTKDVRIDTDTTPSAAFTGDEDLVRRMIVNLIDNAVRHAPSGSTVHVDLDTTDTGYAIAIRDHGPGIPVEIRPHIFERFYRRDAASRLGGHDGAGLGLALARWIANAHGGDVVLARSSQAGSTFVISLPSPVETFQPRSCPPGND